MATKPILFNTDMVRAILSGQKTVTRRVVKLPHCGYFEHEPPLGVVPPYRTGDVLYVRETWNSIRFGNGKKVPFHTEYWYKADDTSQNPDDKWRPSIHMPKEAARIFLRVTSVRAERLQDMTVDDALREGTPDVEPPPICQREITYPDSFPKGFDKWDEARREEWIQSTARARYIGWCDYADKLLRKFRTIWDSTIKQENRALYGWEANPWVWVVEFKRVRKEEAIA